MDIKKIAVFIILLNFAIYNSFAQNNHSKINFYMAYSHAFGLNEKNESWDYKRSRDINIYANSFHIKGMYNFNKWLSAGIGIGADALRNHTFTTFPIYSSIHIKPFKDFNWFLYNNLGYALDTNISYSGLHYEVGVSRQWMLRNHLGFFLNVGYNIKNLQKVPVWNGDEADPYKYEFLSTTRHSLIAGFGLVF